MQLPPGHRTYSCSFISHLNSPGSIYIGLQPDCHFQQTELFKFTSLHCPSACRWLRVYSPTVHWSYGPLVLRLISPTAHWSYGPLGLVLRLRSYHCPIGIGPTIQPTGLRERPLNKQGGAGIFPWAGKFFSQHTGVEKFFSGVYGANFLFSVFFFLQILQL